jgi:hypothetical protein
MLKILPYTAAIDITQAFIYLLHLTQVEKTQKQRRVAVLSDKKNMDYSLQSTTDAVSWSRKRGLAAKKYNKRKKIIVAVGTRRAPSQLGTLVHHHGVDGRHNPWLGWMDSVITQ